MAAVAIPIIAEAVAAIAPQIPTFIKIAEELFGHSSTTGKQDGPSKLQAVVAMGQAALTTLANAGKIHSNMVVDPSTPAAVTGAAQQAVNTMKAAGLLGAPDTAASTTVTNTPLSNKPILPPALPVGTKFSFSGTITPA